MCSSVPTRPPREGLLERGWTIRNHSPLPVILFEDAGGAVPSRELADALEEDGSVWLGCVAYEGRTLLRACMTSFLTERADVDLLLERLDAVRGHLRGARG